jgi:NAD(P)-dependent dehydrogenase (short-subunit alcohol dehydrogenase family)
VLVADINASGAAAVAGELDAGGPGSASSVGLDVADPAAFDEVVRNLHADGGRLDLLFNNAGIAIGGPVEELTMAHWERTIDVNLRGVLHGVRAAYPLMLEQGFGHIVNTASIAGLLAFPFGTPYAMTKHAVVGLSLSLRAEAAGRGVRVSVVCPGVIDTPILDGEGPPDLPSTSMKGLGRELLLRANGGRAYPPDRLAADVLKGVAENRAIIVAPARARVAWLANRIAPRLVERRVGREIGWVRTRMRQG